MENIITFKEPKPKSHYNHYSNPASQGALMFETDNFPKQCSLDEFDALDGYTDRMQSWDYDQYQKACKVLKKPLVDNSSENQIKEFCRIYWKQENQPEHVRVIHFFNVSTGYSCPFVIALFKK